MCKTAVSSILSMLGYMELNTCCTDLVVTNTYSLNNVVQSLT